MIVIDLIADVRLRPMYWITMVLAVLGAYWSSDPLAMWRGAGFFVWVFSNGYLLFQFYNAKNIPMIIMFMIYEVCNTRGVYNNWFM